jgi:ATP-dependent DNA helicase RecQ
MRASSQPLPEPGSEEGRRRELAQRQLRRMEAVAEGEACREQSLLLAVGEIAAPCGRCDNCAAPRPRQDWSEQVLALLAALEERGGRDLRGLAEDLGGTATDAQEEPWGWLARRLVQEELISESDDGAQRLWLRSTGRHYLRSPWPLHWAA